MKLKFTSFAELLPEHFMKKKFSVNATEETTTTDPPQNNKLNNKIIYSKRNFIVGLVVIVIIMICVIISATSYVMLTSDKIVANNSLNEFNSNAEDIKLISRDKWSTIERMKPSRNLSLPVSFVIIVNVQSEECFSGKSCLLLVKTIQLSHVVLRQWSDIGYNFLIDDNGYIYEGRGWHSEGIHSDELDSLSIGIALIGGYRDSIINKKKFEAYQKLINLGLALGYIAQDYKILESVE